MERGRYRVLFREVESKLIPFSPVVVECVPTEFGYRLITDLKFRRWTDFFGDKENFVSRVNEDNSYSVMSFARSGKELEVTKYNVNDIKISTTKFGYIVS